MLAIAVFYRIPKLRAMAEREFFLCMEDEICCRARILTGNKGKGKCVGSISVVGDGRSWLDFWRKISFLEENTDRFSIFKQCTDEAGIGGVVSLLRGFDKEDVLNRASAFQLLLGGLTLDSIPFANGS
jgi:hypothetical protein